MFLFSITHSQGKNPYSVETRVLVPVNKTNLDVYVFLMITSLASYCKMRFFATSRATDCIKSWKALFHVLLIQGLGQTARSRSSVLFRLGFVSERHSRWEKKETPRSLK